MAFVAETCELENAGFECVFICTSGVFTKKLHLPPPLPEDIRRFGEASFIQESVYEQFKVYIRNGYPSSCRRRATPKQATAMLKE